MASRSLTLAIIVLIGAGSSAAAQSSSKVVKIKPGSATYKIKRGSAIQISVVLDIDAGYHINSNRPAQEFLVPTVLKLEKIAGLATSTVLYPAAKSRKFSFSTEPMRVYEGKAILRFTARALPALAAGGHEIRGKLTIQACNDEACLRPQTVDVEIPIEVLPGG